MLTDMEDREFQIGDRVLYIRSAYGLNCFRYVTGFTPRTVKLSTTLESEAISNANPDKILNISAIEREAVNRYRQS